MYSLGGISGKSHPRVGYPAGFPTSNGISRGISHLRSGFPTYPRWDPRDEHRPAENPAG